MTARRTTTVTITESYYALVRVLIWAPIGVAILGILLWLLFGWADSDQVGSVQQ